VITLPLKKLAGGRNAQGKCRKTREGGDGKRLHESNKTKEIVLHFKEELGGGVFLIKGEAR